MDLEFAVALSTWLVIAAIFMLVERRVMGRWETDWVFWPCYIVMLCCALLLFYLIIWPLEKLGGDR